MEIILNMENILFSKRPRTMSTIGVMSLVTTKLDSKTLGRKNYKKAPESEEKKNKPRKLKKTLKTKK